VANTPHPLDIATDNLNGTVRKLMLRAFLADNVIDPIERAALEAHDAETGNVIAYRRREVAADRYKRNGDSRVTRDVFRDAGHGLIDLDAERSTRKGNIIAFRNRPEAS
jgi:hypothetical protein